MVTQSCLSPERDCDPGQHVGYGAYLLLLPAAWKVFFNRYNFLLWMEWIAVWAFAAAWLTKGHAILAESQSTSSR